RADRAHPSRTWRDRRAARDQGRRQGPGPGGGGKALRAAQIEDRAGRPTRSRLGYRRLDQAASPARASDRDGDSERLAAAVPAEKPLARVAVRRPSPPPFASGWLGRTSTIVAGCAVLGAIVTAWLLPEPNGVSLEAMTEWVARR